MVPLTCQQNHRSTESARYRLLDELQPALSAKAVVHEAHAIVIHELLHR